MSTSFFALILALILGMGSGPSPAESQPVEARANIKLFVDAIESCAAGRTDGAYTGPGGDDCLDAATLIAQEPSLDQFEIGTGTPSAGGFQILPVGSRGFGYLVQGATDEGSLFFAEVHQEDGQVVRACGADPIDPGAVTTTDVVLPGCPNGTW